MGIKSITCQLASLNCNSLVKSASKSQQSSFHRYLRNNKPDIYSFQETHATHENIPALESQLKPTFSIWTKHCGLISYSDNFQLTPLDTQQNDRVILGQVSHPNEHFYPFYILNIYAPSHRQSRQPFFNSILDLLQQHTQQGSVDLDRLIITGDFNYSLARPHLPSHTSMDWITFLAENFNNLMTINDCQDIPTFQRSHGIMSTIDYMYASPSLYMAAYDSDIHLLRADWSDHSRLSTTIRLGKVKTGPGLWRANPLYISMANYQHQLENLLVEFFNKHEGSSRPAQALWDQLKDDIQHITKRFGTKHVDWRKSTLKYYQRKRNRFLRSKPSTSLRRTILPAIDQMIQTIHQELNDIAAIKAGIHWREHGERSAGFLKRIHTKRTTQQLITTLATDESTDTPSSDPQIQQDIAHQFYQTLYTSSPVEDDLIDRYLSNIHFANKLSSEDRQSLLEPITIEDLTQQASRMVKTSSPGDDGLGYPYWSYLFSQPRIKQLATQVYNEALKDGLTPTSWKSIRVRLLPKKGSLSSLKNWRPISLINCDGKIFTRILTKRMAPIMGKIINSQQTGFLPQRFIAENGLVLQLILEQARHHQQTGIGLLLDQEKAYDRVLPAYLKKTMAILDFPDTLISSIMALFFNNQVYININGNFTAAIEQQRGLRQGDPLSPLLFNIVLEPFLLALQQDTTMHGFTFRHSDSSMDRQTPPPIKCMAYADDVCVFLRDNNDLERLHHHMDQYASVSNAKFNQHKTEAFALNGRQDATWQQTLDNHNISIYYHQDSPQPFRYLGFTMCYTPSQRISIIHQLLANIRKQVGLYSARHLSIKGRVTIMNTLILSKIWYTLRLLNAPKSFFKSLRSICGRYVSQGKHPLISYRQMCQPLQNGGLGLLDPQIQQRNMQFRWLNIILQPRTYPSFAYDIIKHHLILSQRESAHHLQTLFWPTTRSGPLCSYPSSCHLWFQCFDSIPITIDPSDCNITTCLSLPLKEMFMDIPDGYWITKKKHSPLLAKFSFVYDSDSQWFRPKLPNEFNAYPRHSKRLLKDIMMKKIRIRQGFIPLLFDTTIRPGIMDYSTIITRWLADPWWQNIKSIKYRYHCLWGGLPPYQYHPRIIKYFWTAKMPSQGRTVWYKALIGKIPLQHLISKYHPPQSPLCVLCNQSEDILHFVYSCPYKKQIWNQILREYALDLDHQQFDLANLLIHLRPHTILEHQPQIFTIIGYILSEIWTHHWLWTMHRHPFEPNTITTNILIKLEQHYQTDLD